MVTYKYITLHFGDSVLEAPIDSSMADVAILGAFRDALANANINVGHQYLVIVDPARGNEKVSYSPTPATACLVDMIDMAEGPYRLFNFKTCFCKLLETPQANS
jgi:hypothetical protein